MRRIKITRKIPVILLIMFILTLLIPLSVSAAEDDGNTESAEPSDIYSEQYKASGAGELKDSLPEDARDMLESYGLDPEDPGSFSGITTSGAFDIIVDFFTSGGKQPMAAAAATLAVILLCSMAEAFGSGVESKQLSGVFSYISVLAVAVAVLMPMMSTVTHAVSAIKGCSAFMFSFVPVYAGIVIASGKPLTAGGFQPLLLGATQVVSQLANYFLLPVTGMYLALNVSSAVAPGIKLTGFGEGIKKSLTWIISLVMTLFVGLLGIQTTIQSATDNISLKTAKFMAGSFVPVVGSAVGDTLGTVSSCLTLLKSSVGLYGVIALAVILLPVLLELILWRLTLTLTAAAADIFSLSKISELLKAADTVLSFLMVIVLCTALLFIISITVVIMAGGGI